MLLFKKSKQYNYNPILYLIDIVRYEDRETLQIETHSLIN